MIKEIKEKVNVKNIQDSLPSIKEKFEGIVDVQKVKDSSEKVIRVGMNTTKKGIEVAKTGITKTAKSIQNGSKEAQMAVLSYVDKKKNAKYLEAKLAAYEDGLKAGKIQAVDQVKKFANYCLAITALSFYFARVDGNIDETEMQEIKNDLSSIMKNKDIPEKIRNKINEISIKEDLSFDEVKTYLDGVGLDTLIEFQTDIEEIILADGVENSEERTARNLFYNYLESRKELADARGHGDEFRNGNC